MSNPSTMFTSAAQARVGQIVLVTGIDFDSQAFGTVVDIDTEANTLDVRGDEPARFGGMECPTGHVWTFPVHWCQFDPEHAESQRHQSVYAQSKWHYY